MDKKPSYEELEQKINDFEKREADLLKEISELQLTSKYYDILMENTEDYFVVCDKNGKPQAYNESYKNS